MVAPNHPFYWDISRNQLINHSAVIAPAFLGHHQITAAPQILWLPAENGEPSIRDGETTFFSHFRSLNG
jgi:hypothetical protein